MASQLSVPWKPVSGKWEQCVYWSQWNIIPHRQKAGILEGQALRVCLSVVKSAAGVRLVAVDLFCIPVGANPSRWIRMLMLYDRICISVTSILTSQRTFVGRFILFQIVIFLGGGTALTVPPFLPPKAFGQAYTNQRKVAEDGETNEETLLQESACKEAYYMGRLLELQTEVTLSRSVASNAQAENERLSALVQELREVRWFTADRGFITSYKTKETQETSQMIDQRKQHGVIWQWSTWM